MKLRWIDHYAGTWTDDDGRTLIITPSGESTAAVTLLVNGRPMLRPWCGNKPTVRLRGTYRSGSGPELDVELGRAGFSLNVNYEADAPMSPDEAESLSVGVSQYESDVAAEGFVGLFGKLGLFTRLTAQRGAAADQQLPPDPAGVLATVVSQAQNKAMNVRTGEV